MEVYITHGQTLWLLPEKAIFWKEEKILILADTHFGKVTHFRKSGIAIPDQAAFQNLIRLEDLIVEYQPEKVLFLGDLFHSDMNTEWLLFREILKRFGEIEFILIQGNHDILHETSYHQNKLILHKELTIGPFHFSHEPQPQDDLYNFSGHLHPGVRLNGKGRQYLRLPCFYFGGRNAIMPAFGEFTGLHVLKPLSDDQVFIIANKTVIKVNG